MDTHTHVVIMAGGVGSRFWPMSTPEHPKQFMDVLGCGKSLIQLTVDRFLGICPAEHIWIVTSEKYQDIVREQLPAIPTEQILLEPVARNTAPCIAYACWKIKKRHPDVRVVVTPADAMVVDVACFRQVIRQALDFIENRDAIVTIGIHPCRPDTGYGYISAETTGGQAESEVLKVKEFKEKPDLETARHYLAAGNLIATIQALIASEKAGMDLSWNQACAIDLATRGTGKTVGEAVRTSINPKVIDCPAPASGKTSIDAVAKDGIQVKVRARVTVRTNLERFVGGAQEETIIARVGEGIVTTIGSADTYKFVLENPDRISKVVLSRGLDSGTAYEILSIDIADVDVGDNIGAKLQEAQAEANKNMAQAQAEIRRAAAVALEQEMKARVEEMKAKVVEAEALVPQALAESLRNGNMGFMDYYRMQNIQADTSMRESISGDKKPNKGKQ